MWFKQHGSQRRAQRQRVERRDNRRNGDGQCKLAEELARNAADKRTRNEHRAKHQRNGNHRAGHFVHRLECGLARRKPLRQPPLDILHHNNRIVHHNADRQHQAEQRQVVQAEPHARHNGKCPDDGHRHRHQRNHRRTPVLQKH